MSILKNTAITVLAISTLTIGTYSADAGHRWGRAAALGALGGLVVGAAIANRNNRYDRNDYYEERRSYRPRYGAHTRWCLNRYRSYDPDSNTWMSYGGRLRTCRSPYSG